MSTKLSAAKAAEAEAFKATLAENTAKVLPIFGDVVDGAKTLASAMRDAYIKVSKLSDAGSDDAKKLWSGMREAITEKFAARTPLSLTKIASVIGAGFVAGKDRAAEALAIADKLDTDTRNGQSTIDVAAKLARARDGKAPLRLSVASAERYLGAQGGKRGGKGKTKIKADHKSIMTAMQAYGDANNVDPEKLEEALAAFKVCVPRKVQASPKTIDDAALAKLTDVQIMQLVKSRGIKVR